MSTATVERQDFHLDRARLAAYLLAQEDAVLGFDCEDQLQIAPAVVGRFYAAQAAEAIFGPPDLKTMVYPLGGRSLIVAVREVFPPPRLSWPLRQLATHSFDVDEIAPPGERSFDGCCCGLAELLERANALLPDLRALRAAEARALGSGQGG